ncbi:hypothetical protein [Deinococcus sp. RM]|uniref:hypothetical protein n=1 Tax=Deinococcus sp. RM TaxID=2316359 RepID=UPI0013148165|nr:hypothetical protein [Deinococcus sp. RM]
MKISFRQVFCTALLLLGAASALPGQPTSPQALGVTLALRTGEAAKLVLLNSVRVSGVHTFTSASGRTHLKFTLGTSEGPFDAIMFAGDWTAADRRALESGSASVAGVWGTFANRPSLTVKKVSATPMGTQPVPAAAAQVVRIDRAAVNPTSIGKFTSAAQKVHVTYTFTVNGKTYQGVVYAGTWTSATLDALRAGTVTLYGTWSSFEGKPSFVTRRVDR